MGDLGLQQIIQNQTFDNCMIQKYLNEECAITDNEGRISNVRKVTYQHGVIVARG